MTAAEARNARAFRSIEGLLSHIHPRADMAAVVKTLETRFDSPGAMFAASAYLLEQAGLHPHDALLISRLPELGRCMMRQSADRHPRVGRLAQASQYLVANAQALKVERFYMLCVDARGRLIENVFLQEGTLDSALFSLRGMLAEVVRVSPSAVVLSHNHPMRTLRPSQEDIGCTREAIRALTVLDIPLLDHVIVAGKQAVSMRENGFIPAGEWLRQCPAHPLLANWLGAQDARASEAKEPAAARRASRSKP